MMNFIKYRKKTFGLITVTTTTEVQSACISFVFINQDAGTAKMVWKLWYLLLICLLKDANNIKYFIYKCTFFLRVVVFLDDISFGI